MSEAPLPYGVDPENIKPYYPTLNDFVHQMLLPSWRHLIRKDVRWCRKWYLHSEAVSRLDALWRSYEAMRVGDPTGMASWWRDFMDPTMASLTRESGTFANCSSREGVHDPLPIWPAGDAPGQDEERVLRARSARETVPDL